MRECEYFADGRQIANVEFCGRYGMQRRNGEVLNLVCLAQRYFLFEACLKSFASHLQKDK